MMLKQLIPLLPSSPPSAADYLPGQPSEPPQTLQPSPRGLRTATPTPAPVSGTLLRPRQPPQQVVLAGQRGSKRLEKGF